MILSDAAVASIITAGGGILAAIVAWFLSKGKTKTEFAIQLRDELRGDIKRWKEEAEEFKKEADELRDKYDQIIRENITLKADNERLTKLVSELQTEIDTLKNH